MQSWLVYLEMPTNGVHLEVPSISLETPIDLSLPPGDSDANEVATNFILNKLQHAQWPLLVVDGLTARCGMASLLTALIAQLAFPPALPWEINYQ